MKTKKAASTRKKRVPKHNDFSRAVERALRRAAKAARRTARAYGTPIYVWRDGKVVAEKP
jgi:murein DD-endopeptidase MepM/ murein hydrolase activator NlpD